MATYQSIPAKISTSTVPVSVDFSSRLSTGEDVVSVTVSAVVSTGVDIIPTAILSGTCALSNNIAVQSVTGGTVGVIYLLNFDALTNAGNMITIYLYLAVLSDNMY